MPLLTVTAAASKRIRDIVDEYNEHVQRETSAARRNEPREGEEGGEEEGEEDGVETPEKARAIGIRIGLEKRGCSGLAYTVDVATESNASSSAASGKQTWAADEVVETAGGRLVVASDAVMFLVGTEVDFVDTELERKFVFKNPNEKQSCGCGKSFMA
ncbi:UNVERIFIED_CONTAM: iron-sulfur cluster protein ISCA [Hammondia hammondi]|eukprot:XP_008884046.1 iron-sulfur cluster protein ISCA [Hammondia hammondi]